MNSERELFQKEYCKVQMITDKGDTFEQRPNGDYVRHSLQLAWLMWQASAQRQGYKLVPVTIDGTNIMDMIYGKCQCGSSRAPIISDKEGYSLIHCFACGANKYIHEDY